MQCYFDLGFFLNKKNCNWINVCPWIMHHITTYIITWYVCVYVCMRTCVRMCFWCKRTQFPPNIYVALFYELHGFLFALDRTIYILLFLWHIIYVCIHMKVCFMLMHVIPIPIYKKTGIQTFKYSLCHVLQTQNSNIDGFVLQSGCHKFFVHHQTLAWLGLAWLWFKLSDICSDKCIGQR